MSVENCAPGRRGRRHPPRERRRSPAERGGAGGDAPGPRPKTAAGPERTEQPDSAARDASPRAQPGNARKPPDARPRGRLREKPSTQDRAEPAEKRSTRRPAEAGARSQAPREEPRRRETHGTKSTAPSSRRREPRQKNTSRELRGRQGHEGAGPERPTKRLAYRVYHHVCRPWRPSAALFRPWPARLGGHGQVSAPYLCLSAPEGETQALALSPCREARLHRRSAGYRIQHGFAKPGARREPRRI